MNLETFFAHGLNLIGTFNLKVVIYLFLLCLLSEALAFSIPCLLETTWLLAGYQLSKGALVFPYLVLLWASAQFGRQIGSLLLYKLCRIGIAPLAKYKNHFKIKPFLDNGVSSGIISRLSLLSPFSVALGRLLGLRMPLTVIISTKRKLRILPFGVLLSSIVWDGTYIVLGGTVGRTAVLEPVYILLFFLSALAIIYAISFAIRRLILYRFSRVA